ncbi:MAG: T9SS type A sorting domain-containing protein [Flavobacteriales bacterium]|nr:T9SS type A sorting domain-containing protein [Flavobacteriales bacterium]
MKKIYFLLCCLFSLIPGITRAGHNSGGHVRYDMVQDSVFDVYITFYRNCKGTASSNPSGATKLKCASGGSADISLTLFSIREVTRLCATATPGCYPKNTSFTGQGWEEHTYTTRIDFRSTPYSNLLGCSDLYFELGLSSRPTNISTGPANANAVIIATIDPIKYPSNSSPVFRESPRFYYCCNNPYYLDNGAIDPDGDSLSYALISPKTSYSGSASWSAGYSATNPVTVYNPTGSATPNPNVFPPRGFYIDPTDGFTVFTPTNCAEISLLVIEITEWRKDTAGTYQKVAVTMRETEMDLTSCKDNNLPQLDLNASYSVCEGDSFELDIYSSDQVYTPPPPTPKPDPDTVKISVFSSIPGYDFSTHSDTSLFQSGTFSWRPDSGMARSAPYRFTVIARDNNCPYPGTYMRRVNLYVRQKPKSVFSRNQVDCGTFALDGTQLVEPTSKVTYRILDSTGNAISDTSNHRFMRSGGTHSTFLDDTLVFFKQGTFVIEQSSDNDACKTYQYDTLFTSGKVELLSQSVEEICASIAKTYSISFIGAERISSTKWRFDQASSDSNSITIQLSDGSEYLHIDMVTRDGCTHEDSTELIAIQTPSLKPLNDTVICHLSPALFTLTDMNNPGYSRTSYTWSTGDSVNSLTIGATNQYWGEIRNFCGSNRDSFNVQSDSLFNLDLGADQYACDLDSLFIGDNQPITGVLYDWNTLENSSGIYATKTGHYQLVAKNTCMEYTDSIYLFFDHTPNISWPDTTSYCDQVMDTLRVEHDGATFQWSDKSTADSLIITESGPYTVVIHPKACPEQTINTFAKIITTPVVNIGNDTLLRRPFTIVLNAFNQDASYQWSTGSTQPSVNIHNFGTYWVRVTNFCGTVSDTIAIKDLVGVQSLNQLGYTLYPNPNSGSFHLKGGDRNIELSVTNQLGQEIPYSRMDLNGEVFIQLSNPLPGIYHLNAILGDQTIFSRLMVQ